MEGDKEVAYGPGRSLIVVWRDVERMSSLATEREKNARTYPSKIQGQHEHQMGGEYDQEVAGRVLSNGVQDRSDLDFWELRPLCPENDQQERKRI